MTRIEDMLREEFRHTDQPAPERDAMLARVAKARRRRMAGAAAGLSVVLAGAAVAAISTFQPNGTDVGADLPPRLYSGELINAVFTDHKHGYVVQQRCSMDMPGDVPIGSPTPDVHRECGSQLLVTTDAGRTWRTRTLPGEPAIKDAGVELVSGHSLMLWIDTDGRLALGGRDRRYWTTADGGSTWQESSSPRDVGPSGSWGTFATDGKLTFLATSPPDLVRDKNPIVPATDGSFWVACTARPCVHVTRNHGSTWQTLPTTVDSATAVQWLATSDGHTVFAGVGTATGSRLVRSTDGGTTWTDVLGLAPGAGGLALPNGDLILAQANAEGGMYRLRKGSSVLANLPDAPAHATMLYLTGGIVVATQVGDQRDYPDLESIVSVSADGGRTWTAVPAPPA